MSGRSGCVAGPLTAGALVLASIVAQAHSGESSPAGSEHQQSVDLEGAPAVYDRSVFLVRDPSVRTELRLGEAQIERIRALTDEADRVLWSMRDVPPWKYGQPEVEFLTKTNAALGRILEPEQRTRLYQIALRAQGPQALRRSDTADRLSLTPSQRGRIRTIIEETRDSAARATEASRTARTREPPQDALRQLRIRQNRRLINVLTAPQERQWLRLVGAPFDLSRIEPPPIKAPEFEPVDTWINSKPLTLAQLRGKVVVVHFWTFGCINCVHNYPAYKDWQQRFADKDFTIVGIHTPESQGERNVDTIRQKMKDNGLTFATAVDKERSNWKAWTNTIWPSVYLIDKKGYVRYWWYGELNWAGAEGEKFMRSKIEGLLLARADDGARKPSRYAYAERKQQTEGIRLYSKSGYDISPLSDDRIDELARHLTPKERGILLGKGTERPYCGLLLDNKAPGIYTCRLCGLPLFSSEAKFKSGTGWPSFYQPIDRDHIREKVDRSLGMVRTEITCARCGAHLGHVFNDGPAPTGLRYCLNDAALKFWKEGQALPQESRPVETRIAYFAGGCFWGLEHYFQEGPGVLDAVSGYMQGNVDRPTYDQVCTGTTGHAETVKVVYDPRRITYRQLLEAFFAMHDPTQVNRQGPDIGTQYRSGIWYVDTEQKREAEAFIKELEGQKRYGNRRIATQIQPAKEFWPAEDYHQDYIKKTGRACHVRNPWSRR